MTHDYKRHGTTTLFAALNVLTGEVFGRNMQRHVFHSVVDLQAAINRFIDEHNETEAKPFVWRADPDATIAAGTEVSRCLMRPTEYRTAQRGGPGECGQTRVQPEAD